MPSIRLCGPGFQAPAVSLFGERWCQPFFLLYTWGNYPSHFLFVSMSTLKGHGGGGVGWVMYDWTLPGWCAGGKCQVLDLDPPPLKGKAGEGSPGPLSLEGRGAAQARVCKGGRGEFIGPLQPLLSPFCTAEAQALLAAPGVRSPTFDSQLYC